jgi:hypothetical protein
MTDEDLYNQLAYYTLAHPSPTFIHQHVVDAYAAQHATEATKPITIVFALVGLYLYVEKNFSGRQVQKAHMQLAKYRKTWIRPGLPAEFGSIVISDVVSALAGEPRDAQIHAWCASVWAAWRESHAEIAALVRNELGIG